MLEVIIRYKNAPVTNEGKRLKCYFMSLNSAVLLLVSMGGVAARRSPLTIVISGLIPGLGIICELSLLLILSLTSRVFLRVFLPP
jgi:hypothetical protein